MSVIRVLCTTVLAAPIYFASIGDVIAETDLKRPFAVKTPVMEWGAYFSHEDISGIEQNIVSVPFVWTKFHSDDLDLKFEGSLNFVATGVASNQSVIASPGFTYWIGNDLSLTSYARLGYEHIGATNADIFVYGGDVMLEKTFTIKDDEAQPFYLDEYFIVSGRVGNINRDGAAALGGTSISSSYNSLLMVGAYDWPILQNEWNAQRRFRGKLTASYEKFWGTTRNLDQLLGVTFSIRSVDSRTGLLGLKSEVSFASDGEGYNRIGLGFSKGF